jgi:hypothetical protein
MGYETTSRNDRCYNPLLSKAIISRNVQLEKDIDAYTNQLKLMMLIKQQVQVKMKTSLCSHLDVTQVKLLEIGLVGDQIHHDSPITKASTHVEVKHALV